MTLLTNLLGWAAVIAASVFVLVIPVQSKLVHAAATMAKKASASTGQICTIAITIAISIAITTSYHYSDERVKIVSESLAAIQVVKSYAWEESFEEKVRELRRIELSWILKVGYDKHLHLHPHPHPHHCAF